MSAIKHVWAREILDSRGIPTVETACMLEDGQVCVSSVPAGTSTGTHEALELRDTESARHLGLGVLKAVNNVNSVLGPAVTGMDPVDQFGIDKKLMNWTEPKISPNPVQIRFFPSPRLSQSAERFLQPNLFTGGFIPWPQKWA